MQSVWIPGPRRRGAARNDEEGRPVNDYSALRDSLKRQTLPEFTLSFDEIEAIIDAALPRAAQRASWWDTTRAPEEKMPQREAASRAATSRPGSPTASACGSDG